MLLGVFSSPRNLGGYGRRRKGMEGGRSARTRGKREQGEDVDCCHTTLLHRAWDKFFQNPSGDNAIKREVVCISVHRSVCVAVQ